MNRHNTKTVMQLHCMFLRLLALYPAVCFSRLHRTVSLSPLHRGPHSTPHRRHGQLNVRTDLDGAAHVTSQVESYRILFVTEADQRAGADVTSAMFSRQHCSVSLPVLPSVSAHYIKPCSRNDPDLNACAKQHAIQAIPQFINGKGTRPNKLPFHACNPNRTGGKFSRGNLLRPSSEPKLSLLPGSLLGKTFHPEDVGSIFLRNP